MPSTKNEDPTSLSLPSIPNPAITWILAARPQTWIASISPVCIGTAMAKTIDWLSFFLLLGFALLIQVGTNFANDLFDFLKGADAPLRKGPKRAVAEGWISPKAMRATAGFAFLIACLLVSPLLYRCGWWSFLIALASVTLGILYTAGPKPLGYIGLGELLVFLFFGIIPTCGSFYIQTGKISGEVFLASLAPGLLSSAILIANNLRDETTDRIAGKKTLVVRWGQTFGKWEYSLSVVGALAIPGVLVFQTPSLFFVWLTAPLAGLLIRRAFFSQDPTPLLPGSAFLLFIYTVLFCWAW